MWWPSDAGAGVVSHNPDSQKMNAPAGHTGKRKKEKLKCHLKKGNAQNPLHLPGAHITS